jgi:tetratricopeptide (TPR) repeat protein
VRLILLFYFNLIGLTIYLQLTDEMNKIYASELIILAQNNSLQTKGNYDQYMNAGYQATNRQDYQTALNNFEAALKLRPEDTYALKAIRNLKSYIYDDYMERGYKANQEKDYQTALNYFQKAANERPDDFYARQALRNVQKLIQREVNPSPPDSPSVEKDAQSIFLLILIFTTAIISSCLILVIVGLFKSKSSDKKIEKLEKVLEKFKVNTPNKLMIESAENQDNNQISKIESTQEKSNDSQQFNSNIVSLQQTFPMSKPDPVQQLLLNLEEHDSKKRRKAIWELAQKGDSRAVKPLIHKMINADSYERTLILEALSQINTSSMKTMNQALLLSLQDDNPQVRKNAIRDLTKIYDLINQIYPLINHAALNDDDEEVKEIANWALQKFSFKEKNPQLQSTKEEVNATLITDDSQSN